MNFFNLIPKKQPEEGCNFYTEEQMRKYEKYIADNVGEYVEVMHEIVSEDIHLDIIVIPPTEEANYYKLVTMGMGSYKMNVPKELKKYAIDRAELVIYLPPTWNVKSEKEEDYWPIRQLKTLARLPINNNTWLGFGHTIANDISNTPYADNTKFCSMMLLNSVDKNYEPAILKIKGLGVINLLQVLPLYEEEMEYKLKTDVEQLLELFPDDFFPIVDINRKNYCEDK